MQVETVKPKSRSLAELKLLKAAKTGDLKTIEKIFEENDKATFSQSLFSALLLAVKSNHLPVVKFLCKYTNYTADNYVAARLAVKRKSDFAIVHELLKLEIKDSFYKEQSSHLRFALSLCIDMGFIDVFMYIAPHYKPPEISLRRGSPADRSKGYFSVLASHALRSKHSEVFLPAILDEKGPFVAKISTEGKLQVYERLVGEAQLLDKLKIRNDLIRRALSLHDQDQPEVVANSSYPKLLTIINFVRALDILPIHNRDMKRLMVNNLVEELFPKPVRIPKAARRFRHNALPKKRGPKPRPEDSDSD